MARPARALPDETGTTLDRIQFSDVLQRLRNGEASALVVYSLSRLSRNHAQILLLVDELQQLGVAIHLAKPGRVVGRTADDRIADDYEARLAEIERSLFVERAADGRQPRSSVDIIQEAGSRPMAIESKGTDPRHSL